MLPGKVADYPVERANKLARSGFVLLLESFPTKEIELDDFNQNEESLEGTSEKQDADVQKEKSEITHTQKAERKKPGPKPKK